MSEQKNLEWMYDGKTDPEEYLLGRRIDSSTVLQKGSSNYNDKGFTVDVANKIREDPLFQIKRRELEERKKILDNPNETEIPFSFKLRTIIKQKDKIKVRRPSLKEHRPIGHKREKRRVSLVKDDDRRLNEMLLNAKWHSEKRNERIKRHKRDLQREKSEKHLEEGELSISFLSQAHRRNEHDRRRNR
ncbi:hypothetical protein ACOME3_005995 [Neoechinorhynchus agilis]